MDVDMACVGFRRTGLVDIPMCARWKSHRMVRTYMISCPQLLAVIRSALEIENATKSCLRDLQEVGPPLNINTNPVCEW
jgi:hypothetical protein